MRTSRLIRPLLVCLPLIALSQTALAHRVIIDFDGDQFPMTGEIFPLGTSVFATGSGAVPFDLNFGGGAQAYDFCFGINGVVEFVGSGSACGSSPLLGNYIAPYSAALTSVGSTTWGTGTIDTTHSGTSSDPFVRDDATTPALRFIWDANDTSGNHVMTELMLISLGAGNFTFDMRYGDLIQTDGAPATGTQSFKLGTTQFGPVNGPFTSETNYTFSFVDGVCAACGGTTTPPTSVPEPSTIALLALALGVLTMFSGRTRFRGLLQRYA